MKVVINCMAPKYARGKFEFGTLEEVYHWLSNIKGLSKGSPSRWLFALAKDGSDGGSTARYFFQAESSFHDYSLAREVAFATGLLKGGERYSSDRDVALTFAREWDKQVRQKNT